MLPFITCKYFQFSEHQLSPLFRYVHACVGGRGWMGEMGFARTGSMNNYVRLLEILCLYFVVDGGDGAAVGHNKTRKKKNDNNHNQLTSSKMKRH